MRIFELGLSRRAIRAIYRLVKQGNGSLTLGEIMDMPAMSLERFGVGDFLEVVNCGPATAAEIVGKLYGCGLGLRGVPVPRLAKWPLCRMAKISRVQARKRLVTARQTGR